jgi:hypothetical protein
LTAGNRLPELAEMERVIGLMKRQAVDLVRLCLTCVGIEQYLEGMLDYPTNERKEEASICDQIVARYVKGDRPRDSRRVF